VIFLSKTTLDKQYRDATADISATIKNYSSTTVKARSVTAMLYNGFNSGAGRYRQRRRCLRWSRDRNNGDLSFAVKNPAKWTAETRSSYTTVITLQEGARILETMSSRTGFRRLRSKEGSFLLTAYPSS